MVTVFIRTIIIYLILIGTVRLMGKRQVGELQLSELVITFMLSELATIPIADSDVPLSHAVVPILLLLSVEVILSFATLKIPAVKRLLYGKPSLLIKKGTVVQKELSRQRIELSELICAVRQCGIADISEVEYAVLEENGKISVFPKAASAPATPKQLKINVSEDGIGHALIIDKRVIRDNLKICGWSEMRLERELAKHSCTKNDVFLFSVTDSGSVTLILKEKSK